MPFPLDGGDLGLHLLQTLANRGERCQHGVLLLNALRLRPLLVARMLDGIAVQIVLAVAIVSCGRQLGLSAREIGGTASGSQEPAHSDTRREGDEEKNDSQSIHVFMMRPASDIVRSPRTDAA